MRGHLKKPVAAVPLEFNYETHNASAYKFNNSATFADPYVLPLYQIVAKSNNPRRSYCDLNISNLALCAILDWPEVDFTIPGLPTHNPHCIHIPVLSEIGHCNCYSWFNRFYRPVVPGEERQWANDCQRWVDRRSFISDNYVAPFRNWGDWGRRFRPDFALLTPVKLAT